MTAYFVIAIVIAVGAIVLSAIGLTRGDFPPNDRVARMVIGGALVLVLAGIAALLLTTDVEHPREEAARAEAEKKAESGGKPAEGAAKPAEQGAQRVPVAEAEFTIKLESGNELKAGPQDFAVANQGKVQHDLAIEGNGLPKEPKTPLIDPGKTADLKTDLKPGKYKFYCTVPGHEEAGMKVDVTVR